MTPADLVAYRERHGFSQSDLAALLGVPQSNLSRWETGAVRITAPRAAWLARELDRIAAETPA